MRARPRRLNRQNYELLKQSLDGKIRLIGNKNWLKHSGLADSRGILAAAEGDLETIRRRTSTRTSKYLQTSDRNACPEASLMLQVDCSRLSSQRLVNFEAVRFVWDLAHKTLVGSRTARS